MEQLDINKLNKYNGPLVLTLRNGNTVGPVLFSSLSLNSSFTPDYTFLEQATGAFLRLSAREIHEARLA